MDLLNEQRSIVHSGKLLRQPDSSLNNWIEVFVLLFDNYCEHSYLVTYNSLIKRNVQWF